MKHDSIMSSLSTRSTFKCFASTFRSQKTRKGCFPVHSVSPKTFQKRSLRRNMSETDVEILVPDPLPDRNEVKGAEVVVIGSGVGGLCCAAMLAKYGVHVVVVESHDRVGGAAHSWSARTQSGIYHFESGPSLYSGMRSRGKGANPLAHVFQAIGEELDLIEYSGWKIYFPEGEWFAKVGRGEFLKILLDVKGPDSPAIEEWKRLEAFMEEFASVVSCFPPLAIRNDPGALFTVAGRYFPSLLQYGYRASKLLVPFSKLIEGVVSDPFILDYLDLITFLLSGLPANGTIAAEMAVMFNEWYKPNCCLEFPKGGSQAMVDALVKSIEKNGGTVMTRSHVEEIVIQNGRAKGVRLRNGKIIEATKAVVSNASIWDTTPLIGKEHLPSDLQKRRTEMPLNPSFMHLHVGFDATDLDVELHHVIVNSWKPRVDAEQNVVLVSIPSTVDPSFAPPGKHSLHAYLPATEPYGVWEGLNPKSEAYKERKKERAEVMWKALERIVPDIRERTEISFIGSPLTHERFLRRHRGTYGPAIPIDEGTFPSQMTSIDGLLCCGDSTYPGIGLPAVAASGAIAANTLVSVGAHWKMLSDLDV